MMAMDNLIGFFTFYFHMTCRFYLYQQMKINKADKKLTYKRETTS